MESNFNTTNSSLIVFGVLSMVLSPIQKKEPFATIGIIAGGAVAALGAVDALGIHKFQFMEKFTNNNNLETMRAIARSNHARNSYYMHSPYRYF